MKREFAFACAMVLAIAGPMWAASGDPTSGLTSSVYDVDHQTFAAPNQRTALAVADALDTTTVLATPEFLMRGRQTIFVSARFSNSAQTCKVQLAYIFKSGNPVTGSATSQVINKIKGWSQVFTLTGSSTQKEGAYFEAPDALFDSEGSVSIRVLLIAAPAAGTVTLVTGS